MSALKEFANFITLNVANLAATYDQLLVENSESYTLLPADSRIAQARRLIKTVVEACESGASDPLCRLFDARIPPALPQPLLEVECLGQTLTPVVTNLEAGKFLWQALSEVRAIILRSAPSGSSLASPPLHTKAIDTAIISSQPSESELSQERILLRALIDNLPDYIYAKDTESRFIFLNMATARLLGASSVDEVIGKSDFDFFPPELARQFQADEQALMQSGQSLLNHEERLVDSVTGQTRWNLTSKIPLRDNQGKVIGLVGINRDITKRKQAEEAVRESQQMLQLVMDNVPQSIFWKSKNLVYLGCNHHFAADAGLSSPEEIIGKVDTDLVWREQAELYNADDRRVMEANQAKLNYEEPQTTPSGEQIWLQTSKVPLHDAQGNVIGILGMYRDITERKRAEQAAQASQQRLSSLVQQSPLAIIEWNTAFEVTDWNPAAERIFGYTREESLGRHAAGLLVPEEVRPIVDQVWQELLAQKGGARSTNDNFTKDGRLITCDWYNTPLVGVEGQVIGVASLVDDITERKRLEQQVQESLARRTRQIQAITEVAQRISGTLTLNDLFQQVVDLMQSQFGYYHAQIYTMIEADMVLQAGTGEVGRHLKEMGHKIPFSAEQSLVVRAVWEGGPVLVPDVSQEPTWLPNPLLPETKAELAVPINLGAEILGVLDVQGDKLDSLNEEDRLLLIGLCGQIAIAIETRRAEAERARLLTEVERRAHREQTIREITEQMRAANNLEQLVKITARELGQRLSVGHAVVELGIETEAALDHNGHNRGN